MVAAYILDREGDKNRAQGGRARTNVVVKNSRGMSIETVEYYEEWLGLY